APGSRPVRGPIVDGVHARSAALRRNGDPGKAQLERLLHRFGGILVLPVPPFRVRLQLAVLELAAGVPQQPLLFAQLNFHVAGLWMAEGKPGSSCYTCTRIGANENRSTDRPRRSPLRVCVLSR